MLASGYALLPPLPLGETSEFSGHLTGQVGGGLKVPHRMNSDRASVQSNSDSAVILVGSR
jgi:hypothetical protein